MSNLLENVGDHGLIGGIVESIKDIFGAGDYQSKAQFKVIDNNGEKSETSNEAATPIYKTPTGGYSNSRSYAYLSQGDNGKLTLNVSKDLYDSDSFKTNYLDNSTFKEAVRAYNANSNASTVIPVTKSDGTTENMTYKQLIENYNEALNEFASGYEGYSLMRDAVKRNTGFDFTDDEIRKASNTIDDDDKQSNTKVIHLLDEWMNIYDFTKMKSYDADTKTVSAKDFFDAYNLDKAGGINEEQWNEMKGAANGIVANAYSGAMKKNIEEDAGGDEEVITAAKDRLATAMQASNLLSKHNPEANFWHTAGIVASDTVLTLGNNFTNMVNNLWTAEAQALDGVGLIGELGVAVVKDAATAMGILQSSASDDLLDGTVNVGNYKEYVNGILISSTDGSQSEVDQVMAKWKARVASNDTIAQYYNSDKNLFNQFDTAVEAQISYTSEIAPKAAAAGAFVGNIVYMALEVAMANAVGKGVANLILPKAQAAEALSSGIGKTVSVSNRLSSLASAVARNKATAFAANMVTQATIDSLAYEDSETFINAWTKMDPGAQSALASGFADNLAGNITAEVVGIASSGVGSLLNKNKAFQAANARVIKGVNIASLPKKKAQLVFAQSKLGQILQKPRGKFAKLNAAATDLAIKETNNAASSIFKATTLEEWNIEKAMMEYEATKNIAKAKKGIEYTVDFEKKTTKVAETTTEAIMGRNMEKTNFLVQASRITEGVKAYKAELDADESIRVSTISLNDSAVNVQKAMQWSGFNPAAGRYMSQEASNYVANKTHYDDLIRKQSILEAQGKVLSNKELEKLESLREWLSNFSKTNTPEAINALNAFVESDRAFNKALTDWKVRHGVFQESHYKSLAEKGYWGKNDEFYVRSIGLPDGKTMEDFMNDAELMKNVIRKAEKDASENIGGSVTREVKNIYDQDMHLTNKVGQNYMDPIAVAEQSKVEAAKMYAGKMWYNSLTSIKSTMLPIDAAGKPITKAEINSVMKEARNAATQAVSDLKIEDLLGESQPLGAAYRESKTVDKNGVPYTEKYSEQLANKLGIGSDDQVIKGTGSLSVDQTNRVIATFGDEAPQYGKVRSKQELEEQFATLSERQQEQALRAMGENPVNVKKTKSIEKANPEYAAWKKEKAAFEREQDAAEKAFNKEQRAAERKFNSEQKAAEAAFEKEQKVAEKEYKAKKAAAEAEVKSKEKFESNQARVKQEYEEYQAKSLKKFEKDQEKELKALTDKHTKDNNALEREAKKFDNQQAKDKRYFETRQKMNADKFEKSLADKPKKQHDKLRTEFKNAQENERIAFEDKQKKAKANFDKEHSKKIKDAQKEQKAELKQLKDDLAKEKVDFVAEQKENIERLKKKWAKEKKEFEASLSGVKPEDIVFEKKTFGKKTLAKAVDGHDYITPTEIGFGGVKENPGLRKFLNENSKLNGVDEFDVYAMEQLVAPNTKATNRLNDAIRNSGLDISKKEVLDSKEFEEILEESIDVDSIVANAVNLDDWEIKNGSIQDEIIGYAEELAGKNNLTLAEAEKIIKDKAKDVIKKSINDGNAVFTNDVVIYRVVSSEGNKVNKGDLSWLSKKEGDFHDNGLMFATLNEEKVLGNKNLTGSGDKYVLRIHAPEGTKFFRANNGDIKIDSDMGVITKINSDAGSGGELILTPNQKGKFVKSGEKIGDAEYVDVYLDGWTMRQEPAKFERKEFNKPAPEETITVKETKTVKSTVTALDQPNSVRAWNQAVSQTNMVDDLNKTFIQERVAPATITGETFNVRVDAIRKAFDRFEKNGGTAEEKLYNVFKAKKLSEKYGEAFPSDLTKKANEVEEALKKEGYTLEDWSGRKYNESVNVKIRSVTDAAKGADDSVMRAVKPAIYKDGKIVKQAEVDVMTRDEYKASVDAQKAEPRASSPKKMSESTRQLLDDYISENSLKSWSSDGIETNGKTKDEIKQELDKRSKKEESFNENLDKLQNARQMEIAAEEGWDPMTISTIGIADNIIDQAAYKLSYNKAAQQIRDIAATYGVPDDTIYKYYVLSGALKVDADGTLKLNSSFKQAFRDRYSKRIDSAIRAESGNANGSLTTGEKKQLLKDATDKLENYMASQWRRTQALFVDRGAQEVIDTEKMFKAIEGEMSQFVDNVKNNRNIVQVLDEKGEYQLVQVDPIVADLYRTRPYVIKGKDTLMRKISRISRLGNTSLNIRSVMNQNFKDTFQSVVMAGWSHTITTYSNELADMFGDQLVKHLQETMGEAGWDKFSEGLSDREAKLKAANLLTQGQMGAGAYAEAITSKEFFKKGSQIANYSEAELKQLGLSAKDKARKSLLDWLEDSWIGSKVNNARELYFRKANYAAAFTDALKRGQTVQQARITAEFVSRNATTNFQNTFMWGNWICDSVPFLSAAINGSASFWRLFEMDPLGVLMRINAAGLAMIAEVASSSQTLEDRKKLANIPDYEKKSHAIFIYNGEVFKIPLPEEVSAFLAPFAEAAEKMNGSENRSWLELLYNDALDISPINLDGFSTDDQTALTKNQSLIERLSREAQVLISQVSPPIVKTIVMQVTGEDPYTGNPIDTSHVWYDDEGNMQVMDYTQSEFARFCSKVAKKFGWELNPSAASKLFSSLFGTGTRTTLDYLMDIGEIFTGNGVEGNKMNFGEAVTHLAEDAASDVAAVVNVEDYELQDRYDREFKNLIKSLDSEKKSLLTPGSTYTDTIEQMSKLDQSADNFNTKKTNLTKQALQEIEDFREKAYNAVKTFTNHYGADYDDKKFASVVALLNFSNPTIIPTTNKDFQDMKQEYYRGRQDAYQTMIDMGFSSSSPVSMLGITKRNAQTGEVYTKFFSPVAILNAGNAVFSSMGNVVNADIAVAMDTAGINRQKMFEGYYAAKAQGNAAAKQYKKDWNSKVVKAIAPIIYQYGAETVLSNSTVKDYLDNYIFVSNPYKVEEYLKEIFNVEDK